MESGEGTKAGVHRLQGYSIIYPGGSTYGQVILLKNLADITVY